MKTREMQIRNYLSNLIGGRLSRHESKMANDLDYLLIENFRLWSILTQAGIDPDAPTKG